MKVSVSGGTRPYKYSWSDRSLRGVRPGNVGPGSYSVTVSDKFGAQFVSEITLVEPDPIAIEVGEVKRISGFRKNDGSAVVTASGGTGELKYQWSNGSTNSTLANVGPGIYNLRVADENNCQVQTKVEIKKEKYIPELDISKVGVGQTLRINELSFDADSTGPQSGKL